MQDWRENYEVSNLKEFLKGICVDDKRTMMEKFKLGTRINGELFEWDEGYESEDV